MKELKMFNALLTEFDMGGGRKEKSVIDTETGEIMLKSWQGGWQAFSEGYSAAYFTVMISKEDMPNGVKCYYVRDQESDELITTFFTNKAIKKKNSSPKHSGGKETFTGFSNELLRAARDMPDEVAGTILRMTSFTDWKTGMLVNTHGEPLSFTVLRKRLGYGHTKMADRIAYMKQLGCLTQNSDGYFISKDYIGVRGF